MRLRTNDGGERLAVRAILALLLAQPFASVAHETAVPLAFWADNFDFADARCQVEVGDGAALCGLRAWDIRRDCLLDELAGGTCDEEAADQAIQEVRIAVFQGQIDPVCRNADLPTLLFSDLQDVQFDVVTFCRELENAAVSVVFNPYFNAGDRSALGAAQRDCIRDFAAVTTKAFNKAFRSRKTTLDHIANRRRTANIKTMNVEKTDQRVAALRDALQTALLARCAEEEFQSLYGFSTEQAVALVTSRSACLTVRTYPVIAFECPDAVCGNGMREPNERCDDGNTEDGDGCNSFCQVEL